MLYSLAAPLSLSLSLSLLDRIDRIDCFDRVGSIIAMNASNTMTLDSKHTSAIGAACVVVLASRKSSQDMRSSHNTTAALSRRPCPSSSSYCNYSVLKVSRGAHTTSQWGLPGGKVDATDASPAAAAARELLEETGLQVDTSSLELVFEADVGKVRSACYLLRHVVRREDVQMGLVSSEGYVQWAEDWSEIVDNSPFKEYNAALRELMRREWGVVVEKAAARTGNGSRRLTQTHAGAHDVLSIRAYVLT